MRRITALLLMLLLLPGLVAAEDDFDLDDILSDADPDVVKTHTVSRATQTTSCSTRIMSPSPSTRRTVRFSSR